MFRAKIIHKDESISWIFHKRRKFQGEFLKKKILLNIIYKTITVVKKKRKTMNTTKTPILGKISLINLTRCDGTIVSEWGKWTMLNRLHIPRAAGHTLNNRVETTRIVNFFLSLCLSLSLLFLTSANFSSWKFRPHNFQKWHSIFTSFTI